MPENFNPHSYRYHFDDSAGYDCMTGAFWITDHAGETVAQIDLRFYGQEPCEHITDEVRRKAETITKRLTDALNGVSGPNGRVWPEWIDCKAKMPDHDQLLLIRMKDGSTIGGVLRSSRGFVSKFTGWAVQDVTHWLPMPPHPEDSHPATGMPQGD